MVVEVQYLDMYIKKVSMFKVWFCIKLAYQPS